MTSCLASLIQRPGSGKMVGGAGCEESPLGQLLCSGQRGFLSPPPLPPAWYLSRLPGRSHSHCRRDNRARAGVPGAQCSCTTRQAGSRHETDSGVQVEPPSLRETHGWSCAECGSFWLLWKRKVAISPQGPQKRGRRWRGMGGSVEGKGRGVGRTMRSKKTPVVPLNGDQPPLRK